MTQLQLLGVAEIFVNARNPKVTSTQSYQPLRMVGASFPYHSAFVLFWKSHDPSTWRFIPILPGFLVAAVAGGLHDPDVRQFEIKVLFLNAVFYALVVFACYPHFIRHRKLNRTKGTHEKL
jgi:hypothetical protein